MERKTQKKHMKTKMMKTKKNRKQQSFKKKSKSRYSFNNKKFHKTLGKEMKKLRCSPAVKNKNYSCLSDETLYDLRDLWNARHPDHLIKTNDPREIWNKLNYYLKKTCDRESCWLKQKFVAGKLDKELEDSFAPESPEEWKKNPNEWLSSMDILNVMKQYEKAYKCFDFLGPSPIDYDTKKMFGESVWPELADFNLKDQIKRGKTKIGIIFNTDPHYKSGSHWISLFINIKKKQIFFFDSVGDKIPPQVKKFVDNVIEQGHNMNPRIDFTFDQNYGVEHQYKNSECGVYSLFFIVHMLEDKITGHYLKTHILKDEYMEKFRKIYFNEDL